MIDRLDIFTLTNPAATKASAKQIHGFFERIMNKSLLLLAFHQHRNGVLMLFEQKKPLRKRLPVWGTIPQH